MHSSQDPSDLVADRLLKYASCRAVLSCALSQRFLLDATVLDPVARFELLNLLLCVEMLALSIAWWFIFSPSDSVFRHILDSASAAEPEGVGAEGIVLEERAAALLPGSKQEPPAAEA